MIPVLFPSSATEFDSQGLGALSDAISCTVTEEINGEYELTMEYPVSGIHFFEIEDRAIICAIPSPYRERQPFRIYLIESPLDGVVTIHAHHLSYDLSGIPVSPFTASTCAGALAGLVSHSAVTNPFSVWTNVNKTAPFKLTVPTSFRSCLGGGDTSILGVYGDAEFEFDKYAVRLREHRGSDNNVRIAYGKNLTDFNMEKSLESLVTGVYPYWADYDGERVVELTEKVIHVFDPNNPSYLLESGGDYLVDSNGNYLMVQTPFPYENVIAVDLTSEFEEPPKNAELKAAARKYIIDNALGVPRISLNISFVDLSRVDDYKDLAVLEYVDLGDTITVEFPLYGISAKAEIVSIETDVLLDKYSSLTIGNTKATIADTISVLKVGSATLTQVKMYSSQAANAPVPAENILGGMLNSDVIYSGFIGADSITAGIIGADVIYAGTMSADNITAGTLGADIVYAGTVSADNITAGTLGADIIYGGTVDADHINAGTLDAGVIYSGEIAANKISAGTLDSDVIYGGEIAANKISAGTLDSDVIYSGSINASQVSAGTLGASVIYSGSITGSQITAGTIEASKLDATTMSAAYANVDLLNTVMWDGEALVSDTGYIRNATITDLTVNKLRLQGENGLYYMMNIDAGGVPTATALADLSTYGTHVTGQTIIDGTVTADKIYVSDLYALNATIGGLHIASGSIYSGSKTSVSDNNLGLYMDSLGQMALKGTNGYIKFYDSNNTRKLEVVADSLYLGSTSVEDFEYTVEIQVTAISYANGTATLKAQPYKNNVALTSSTTPTISSLTYAWTKIKNGTRTSVTGSSNTLSVTDLDAIYEVAVS